MDQPEPVSDESFKRPAPVVAPDPIPSRNAMLRDSSGILERLLCLQTVPGNVAIASATVNTAKATIREPDPLALKTEIRNEGDNTARVYEAGLIVAVVPSGQQLRLAERGRLKLEGDTLSGSTYLVVLTHQRSACGDVVEFLAPDTDPVGSFLL